MNRTSLFQLEFLKPNYWLVWLGILLLWLVCFLPLRLRWAVGGGLGRLGMLLAKRRRHIAQTNLRLCFPELDARALDDLVRRNFISNGISIVETAVALLRDARHFSSITDMETAPLLREAEGKGKGVLLLGMHLSALDFTGSVLAQHCPFDVMYRSDDNKLIEVVMRRGRERNYPATIEKDDIRQVVRRLRQGKVVWYAPDQDYGRRHSVFAPFFGIPAASITATARIVKMTDAEVVVYSHYRDLEAGRYKLVFERLPGEFPTGDDVADCTLVNQMIEQAIRRAPDQYWWLHRRFKTRPEGEEMPYEK